jgi:ubiquinone/menaquinone biosynthesis C-methylase UbiE
MNGQNPRKYLRELVTGFFAIHLLREAVRMDLPELMSVRPYTVQELAAATRTHAPALERLMDGLVGRGVFAKDEHQRFVANEVSNLLLRKTAGSNRPMVLDFGGEHYQHAWTQLGHTLATGKPAFDRAHGVDFWTYMDQHPDMAANFNEFMIQWSESRHEALLDAYDFAGIRTLVDVGGGAGGYIARILQDHPQMRGVLFDRPQVETHALKHLRSAGVDGRCKFQGGNFFESVPAGADAYLLSHVLHDWPDAEAKTILTNCRRSIKPSGRILLEEVLATDGTGGNLLMMVLFGDAKNRTEAEFIALFQEAGFRCSRVVPTNSDSTLLEFVVAE